MKKLIAIALICALLAMTGCIFPNNEGTVTVPPPTEIPSEPGEANETENPNGGEENMDKIYATITMEDGGVIKLELYPDIAPETVRNFCYLARQGFYDGLTFHRVISGFMIQGGDPNGNGSGGPGYCIKGEFAQNGFDNPLKHTRGVISMARRSKPFDSAGSQFFIMHVDYPSLNGGYAAFGMVLEGMDVVDRIAAVPTDRNNKPLTPVVIRSITIEGPELPEPNKLPAL